MLLWFLLLPVIDGCLAIESVQEPGQFVYQIEHHIGHPSVSSSHSSSHPRQQKASTGFPSDVCMSPNDRAHSVPEVVDHPHHLQIQIEEPDLGSAVVDDQEPLGRRSSRTDGHHQKLTSAAAPELTERLLSRCNQQQLGDPASPITDPDPARCPICLSEFQSSDLNFWWEECRHQFHNQCIQPWIDNNHLTCPLCRQLIPADKRPSTQPSLLSIRSPTTHRFPVRPLAHNELWRDRYTNLMLAITALVVLLLLVKENWMR
ncbi:uncharacterized protein PGTG_15440 [Puccinia graminis f. sp. tritici CRL 75-36-700-3]|uniref:RING-type domain-containing protein n=1 Tax=Puccinia graminis f. sp. tritici (strain CRL 75-36-700-3 / race SCCL) TaxID=418459 RepID=E3KZQ9_PUCGT|nr:uncharacterized protein PGTG_15440 [Puccinia graminis f. sp. tritici CRL 75-36-700-3]EFP89784.1 hypothetical protein PGTG_15440 [Puccinia graminis f. sp. tritici CRL 75-36-700-3]